MVWPPLGHDSARTWHTRRLQCHPPSVKRSASDPCSPRVRVPTPPRCCPVRGGGGLRRRPGYGPGHPSRVVAITQPFPSPPSVVGCLFWSSGEHVCHPRTDVHHQSRAPPVERHSLHCNQSRQAGPSNTPHGDASPVAPVTAGCVRRRREHLGGTHPTSGECCEWQTGTDSSRQVTQYRCGVSSSHHSRQGDDDHAHPTSDVMHVYSPPPTPSSIVYKPQLGMSARGVVVSRGEIPMSAHGFA